MGLERAVRQEAGATAELLARFAADRQEIIASLLGAVDPGQIMELEPATGDLRQSGRSVTRLFFADGQKLVYRPRSVAAHQWFSAALDWLNQYIPHAGLRAATVLSRPGYGWAEYIDRKPPAGPADADHLYRRYGTMLALMYAVDVLDIEPGHLVACNDRPVAVGIEAIFHPGPRPLADAADPAAAMLDSSVHRTGLLESLNPDIQDLMALERSLLAGFRQGYNAIAAHRSELTCLVLAARDLEVRLHPRPASEYRRILASSAPGVPAREAGNPEARLATLLADRPPWPLLVPHELADLRAGGIPLFTGRPGSLDVWTSAGVRLSGALDQRGADRAISKIAGLSEVDRRDQEWVISASLAASRSRAGHHSAAAQEAALTGVAAEPARLLAAACGLADQIVSRSLPAAPPHRGRVNWIGLLPQADGTWTVRPMEADLAHGYLGVALYLAQLADLTGIGRYAEVARQALAAMPSLLGQLRARQDLLSAIGCGGYSGMGGISYGLARMSILLHDPLLSEWALTAVELTAVVGSTERLGWVNGASGCLAAMSAVWSEIGSRDAAGLALTTAHKLADLAERTDRWSTVDGNPPGGGFSSGLAGVGWSLARFAAVSGETAWQRAGAQVVLRALRLAEAAKNPTASWCDGAAGLLAARCCLTDQASLARLRTDLLILGRRPIVRDLSLCHGETGIAEAISIASKTASAAAAPQLLRQRSGLLLAVLRRHDRYCGTPGEVTTPGLLTGLAGIGYELLRLGFPNRVPSVLLLEPSPAAPATNGTRRNDSETE